MELPFGIEQEEEEEEEEEDERTTEHHLNGCNSSTLKQFELKFSGFTKFVMAVLMTHKPPPLDVSSSF